MSVLFSLLQTPSNLDVLSCIHYKHYKKEDEEKAALGQSNIGVIHLLKSKNSDSLTDLQNSKRKDFRAVSKLTPYSSTTTIHKAANGKEDGRRKNVGSSKRNTYSIDYKLSLIEEVEQFINDDAFPDVTNPTLYFRHINCTEDQVQRYVAQYGKWARQVESMTERKLKNIKKASRGASPYHKLEHRLYQDILSHRKKGLRVSNTFIRARALHIFNELKSIPNSGLEGKDFKASIGWRINFIKRKKLKYRKRKSGKNKSPNDHVPAYLAFLQKLRFDFLQAKTWDPTYHPLCGRFLPEHRYNMDQVPLPFVVNQEYTYLIQTH